MELLGWQAMNLERVCQQDRIRESWRKQKHSLGMPGGYDILFTYSVKEVLTYEEIYEAVGKIIDRIAHGTAE